MPVLQLRTGVDNFSYLIYCGRTRKAAAVDPSWDAAKVLEIISAEALTLLYVINTHHHADHVCSNQALKRATGCRVVASEADGRHIEGVEILVSEGEEIQLGDVRLRFILTPGHTPGSLCILVNNDALLTGDTLFIGDCGRTDLPGGSDLQIFQSLQRLKSLQDHLTVYPGHDYGDVPYDTLGRQKRTNKALLARSLEECAKIP
ncbi:MAG: hydroxyacylglutathione hydrolase family protein [Candidatus Thermoplasmatota archaeon]